MFKVIKAKINFIPTYIYLTFLEIIQNLENIFGEFDKIAKSDTFLYNSKFDITISNFKEIFDFFLTKFTLVIALLDFIDWHKISNY